MRQAEMIADALRQVHPGIEVVLQPVATQGDRDSRPFEQIGGRGLFVKEVEAAVAEGRADLAVHSAKDLTSELAPGCRLLCVPARGPAHDVVVGSVGATGEERLGRLRDGARVGTSSMRRRAQLAEAAPNLIAEEFRGNLDTRLRKVADGIVDAAIVAAAGVGRLGVKADAAPLDPSWWVPAPAQGALAVEGLDDRIDLEELLRPLHDEATAAAVRCERAFSAALEGGCSVPLGCLAEVRDGRLVVAGYLGSPDGGYAFRDRVSGPLADAAALGTELAGAIADGGGRDILDELRATGSVEPAQP